MLKMFKRKITQTGKKPFSRTVIRAALWIGRAWRGQNVYEWHLSQDEILKSGKWSIGNRTKYFGIKPKLQVQRLELGLM